MFKISTILILIFIISSCDVPRNRQTIYDSSYSTRTNMAAAGASSFFDDSQQSTNTKAYNPDAGIEQQPTTSTIPAQYQHCLNSENQFPSTSSYLGNYFICQQQADKSKILLRPQNSINKKVCLIPMYTNGSSSLNIGDAQCQYISSTSTGVEFHLYKNRQGFEHYVINAVMIMKDEAFLYPYPYTLKYNTPIANSTAFYMCMNTAYQTAAYCQAFAKLKQYQLHHFN